MRLDVRLGIKYFSVILNKCKPMKRKHFLKYFKWNNERRFFVLRLTVKSLFDFSDGNLIYFLATFAQTIFLQFESFLAYWISFLLLTFTLHSSTLSAKCKFLLPIFSISHFIKMEFNVKFSHDECVNVFIRLMHFYSILKHRLGWKLEW